VKQSIIVLFVILSIVGCNSRERTPAKGSVSSDTSTPQQASAKLMQQGVDFINQKDIAKAVVSFEGAIQVDPSNPQPYLVLSEIFLRMQSYPQAIEILERAVKVFPDNGYVFYLLSLANQGNKNALPAVLAARKSAELFQAQNNQEGYKQSMILMESLIQAEQQKQSAQNTQDQGQKPQTATVNQF
jgi:Tfp pilus assembly protein PilF